jgi:hypothetical protein
MPGKMIGQAMNINLRRPMNGCLSMVRILGRGEVFLNIF